MLGKISLPIATEPPKTPPSGSLFLFDRKKLKRFRKDGHSWSKESHVKLRVDGVPVLECCAHGKENENFQRRIYWRLKRDSYRRALQDIVLVHYLEAERKGKCSNRVKGPNLEIREPEDPDNGQYIGSLNNQQEPEQESAQSGDVREDLFPNSSVERQELSNLQHTAEESQNRECNVTKNSKNVHTFSIPLHANKKADSADDDQLHDPENFLAQGQEPSLDYGLDDFLTEHWDQFPEITTAQNDIANCMGSPTMLCDVEIIAENIVDSALHCHTPGQEFGSNPVDAKFCPRQKFERQFNQVPNADTADKCGDIGYNFLLRRFEKFLSVGPEYYNPDIVSALPSMSKIIALLKEDNDDWDNMMLKDAPSEVVNEWFLQKFLKEKLFVWLLHKVAEGGKGAYVLDEDGQGVLHLAAALDYDWAIESIIIAGVNINFPDENGWTALQWATYCGRKRTIELLRYLGAAPRTPST